MSGTKHYRSLVINIWPSSGISFVPGLKMPHRNMTVLFTKSLKILDLFCFESQHIMRNYYCHQLLFSIVFLFFMPYAPTVYFKKMQVGLLVRSWKYIRVFFYIGKQNSSSDILQFALIWQNHVNGSECISLYKTVSSEDVVDMVDKSKEKHKITFL